MKKEKLMIKEKGLFRSSGIKSPVALKDLRGKIILTALIFLIIILIYQTYFESTTSNNDSENDKLIKLSNSPSQNLFENKDNTSERIFHPTIASNERNYYLVAFEMVGINGTSSIWLSSSVNGKTWTTPKIFDNNQFDVKKPRLNYLQEQYFVLSYEINKERYFNISLDGTVWSTANIEFGDVFPSNQSIYYGDGYLLTANNTGLWLQDFEKIENIQDQNKNCQKLIGNSYLNASILKINDNKFLIFHENYTTNHNSIILTSINLEEPDSSDTIIKWDLLIIFIILGIIFLALVIQEVAHD